MIYQLLVEVGAGGLFLNSLWMYSVTGSVTPNSGTE